MNSKTSTTVQVSRKPVIDVRSKQKLRKVQSRWVKAILAHVYRSEKAEGEVSVVFVEDEEMSKLNGDYRKRKGTTDVLAFGAEPSPLPHRLLGDIVISIPTAVRQAHVQKHSLHDEVGFLLIHGLLHLLGHDHQKLNERKKMFQKQKKYFRESKRLFK